MKRYVLVTALAVVSLSTPIASSAIGTNITCDFGKGTETGLIILSGSLPDSQVGGRPTATYFEYKRVGSGPFSLSEIILDRTVGFFKTASSDFEEQYGRLFVMRLKAGDYVFKGYHYKVAGNYERTVFGLRDLPFHVEAGRATYLGSFSDNFISAKNLIGQEDGRAWYTVIDKQTRDLKVFAQKCPAFDSALIDVHVLDPSPWITN